MLKDSTRAYLASASIFAAAVAFSAPLILQVEGPVQLPLFDAHIHLQPGDNGREFVELGQENGITGMAFQGVLDSTPLARRYPDYCVPCAWATEFDELTVDEIAAQLDKGARCIGELSIKHFPSHGGDPVDYDTHHPHLMAVYALAGSLGVPVNVHVDYSPDDIWQFSVALGANPNTDFVWAHSGDATAPQVDSLLAKHPNLHADISCRNDLYPREVRPGYDMDDQSIMDKERILKPSWQEVFERYPERFIFGTDIGPPGRKEIIDQVVDYYRDALNQLSPAVRYAIAWRNAAGLYPTKEEEAGSLRGRARPAPATH